MRIYGWLNTHLSVARFYGGCEYNGHRYVIAYYEENQPLVREDVMKSEQKALRAAASKARNAARKKQKTLL